MNSLKEHYEILIKEFQNKSIDETLLALSQKFADKVAFSTSFGYEDQIVSHMIFSKNLPIKVFTLDTGRLFEETYKTFSKTIQKYNSYIDTYFPDKERIEKLMSQKGPYSFYESIENRKECCHIRKIEPLKRALNDVSIWITGLRADQSDARKEVKLFEYDEGFNLIKYNPLINWTLEQVIEYIKEYNIPYNVLHDKGYVSIGCAPCTRAIRKGEDFRAGRWWWESNSKKECGLHEK